jgi:DNA-binding response OmpR family regulator
LPRLDGNQLCQRLRAAGSSVPVLMLTARDQLDDTLAGFAAGADDYLTKPFSLQEVEARVRALVRRAKPNRSQVLRVADLELDLGSLVARRAGAVLDLQPGTRKLLVELMRASPHVVPKERLEVVLWGDEPPGPDALRAQIYALRRAIDRTFDRPLLHTVHGVGYRLCPTDEPPTS